VKLQKSAAHTQEHQKTTIIHHHITKQNYEHTKKFRTQNFFFLFRLRTQQSDYQI
jgi:hypothetical protein